MLPTQKRARSEVMACSVQYSRASVAVLVRSTRKVPTSAEQSF